MENFQFYSFTSGEHKGKSLKEVLIIDSAFIGRQYNHYLLNCHQYKNNSFYLAVEDLMEKLKIIKSAQICPICKKDDAKLFLVPEFGGLKKSLVCCFKKKCQETLLEINPGQLVGIHRYFIIFGCLNGRQRKIMTQIFKTAYPPDLLVEELNK